MLYIIGILNIVYVISKGVTGINRLYAFCNKAPVNKQSTIIIIIITENGDHKSFFWLEIILQTSFKFFPMIHMYWGLVYLCSTDHLFCDMMLEKDHIIGS